MSASQGGNFSIQEFSGLGALLVGGRVYTYIQGTTTQKNAFIDPTATTPHTYTSDGLGGVYIALNARGELPAPLYLTTGSYDIALKDSTGAAIWTRRADPVGDAVSGLASIVSDTVAFVQQLLTSAGLAGMRLLDQLGTRKFELLSFGSTNAGAYGISPGMVGANTPVGVDFSIGVADAKAMSFAAATGNVGVGTTPPAAGTGRLGIDAGGIKFNNSTPAGANALGQYEGAGVWTPAVKFGGLSVALTYATQSGTFIRIGRLVFARMRIVLANKGSSTGIATIQGLPYAPSNALGVDAILGEFLAMTALSAGTCYALEAGAGSTTMGLIVLDQTGATSTTITRSDAAFTNGSVLDVAFNYEAA